MPTPLAIALGVAGFAWGLVSDRIAARWPEHEDASIDATIDASIRGIDWRTLVVALIGAAGLAALPGRFADVRDMALFGAYFVVLTLLLATDLDQRLLPDVVTLPLAAIVLAVALAGINPLIAGQLPLAVAAAVGIPALLFVLSIPFGEGAIGIGDLKLLVSVGLMSGLDRSVLGLIGGALVSGLTIAVLLVTRRVTLRSYIPFGPFLILGAFWAVLVPR